MPKITVKSWTVLIESTERSEMLIVFVADVFCQGHRMIGATVLAVSFADAVEHCGNFLLRPRFHTLPARSSTEQARLCEHTACRNWAQGFDIDVKVLFLHEAVDHVPHRPRNAP